MDAVYRIALMRQADEAAREWEMKFGTREPTRNKTIERLQQEQLHRTAVLIERMAKASREHGGEHRDALAPPNPALPLYRPR